MPRLRGAAFRTASIPWECFYCQLPVYDLQIAYRPRCYLVVADVFSMFRDQIKEERKKKKINRLNCMFYSERRTKNCTSGLVKCGLQSLELLQRVVQRTARQCIPILYYLFNCLGSRQHFD